MADRPSIYECDHKVWVRSDAEWNEGYVLLHCQGCGWTPKRRFPDGTVNGPSAVELLARLSED